MASALCLSDVSRVGIRELASPKLEVRLSTNYLPNPVKAGFFYQRVVALLKSTLLIWLLK